MNVFRVLKNHKSEIKAKYDVKRIGIFGSYAKGLQDEESDIDVLVEFENPTFDNFMELSFYLEDLFGKSVDLLTPKSLSPYMRSSVEKEVVWCE
ncbi:nucleotidyltransferase family protein [Methanobacterium alkalithermotolerans]|uniref:protein adenylyltransferase n=1 Tax=Methanobacterium alkalithermotolerans TaxID=2731220 RepID=A0A8T8K2F7_9EURY|nr:nucleotidyltransferase family protein [Methanobacterium alkalithermotolerans]QUH22686.1 nucleotidyltransferase family protein [Methanobacterium alkalithermotolerans]